MLKQLHTKFEDMSKTILSRMDEMGSRLDDLEKSLGDLVQEESTVKKTDSK